MTTHTQDTHPQDPIDRFTLRIEELRRDSVLRGPMRLLHNLFLDFFISMFRQLAGLAEQRRNGTLPEMAQASVRELPSAWPPLRQRESRWAEYRKLYDPWSDSTTHEQIEQPEMAAPVEALQAGAPCEMQVIEQPITPSPRRARVRKLKVAAHSGDATYEHIETSSMWLVASAEGAFPPPSRGLKAFRPTIAGFLRPDSKKWALGGLDKCVHFVTN